MKRETTSWFSAPVLVAVIAWIAFPAAAQEYLGRLGGSPYSADSTANPYGRYGSPYSAQSVNNELGRYGSPYSSEGARNPYTTGGPRIVAEDGTYLGRLNANRFDSESVANPFGTYGSPTSSKSINNPTGRYGSPYSRQSPNNPYTTQSPRLFGETPFWKQVTGGDRGASPGQPR